MRSDLVAQLAAIEKHKVSTDFWKAWTEMDGEDDHFASWVKDHFDLEALELLVAKNTEEASTSSFLNLINGLVKKDRALRGMHKVKKEQDDA